jgi:hypothetical protein
MTGNTMDVPVDWAGEQNVSTACYGDGGQGAFCGWGDASTTEDVVAAPG